MPETQIHQQAMPIYQEHSDAPIWGIQQFPDSLARAVKSRAAIAGKTITEFLVDELSAVADRLERDSDARAPEVISQKPVKWWNVKHFPVELRERLKMIARNEGTPLYTFVIRELTSVVEDGGNG